jgi:hypothetical protein
MPVEFVHAATSIVRNELWLRTTTPESGGDFRFGSRSGRSPRQSPHRSKKIEAERNPAECAGQADTIGSARGALALGVRACADNSRHGPFAASGRIPPCRRHDPLRPQSAHALGSGPLSRSGTWLRKIPPPEGKPGGKQPSPLSGSHPGRAFAKTLPGEDRF